MEKFSKWRDPGSGIAPFLLPIPPSTATLAPIVKVGVYPLAWLLAGVRTALFYVLLALHVVLVDVLLSVCFVIPPVHSILTRIITAVLSRMMLVVLGFIWIATPEKATLKRTARTSVGDSSAPGRGDVIVANWSSIFEILYLAFRYNPTFVLPVSSTGSKASAASSAKITSFRRVSLASILMATGKLPERSERGETLEEASKAASGPLVVFPECTTSNNRALLRFGALLDADLSSTKLFLKTFIISFKYDPPTRLSPSITIPIPTIFNPLPQIFQMNTSPLPRQVLIRRLNSSECPKISGKPRTIEWEAVAEALAATGRWKRTALDWEAKGAFLEFRAKRK